MLVASEMHQNHVRRSPKDEGGLTIMTQKKMGAPKK
jgi:hypothetical protein